MALDAPVVAPMLSVTHDPSAGRTYWAERGAAHGCAGDGHDVPLRVSATASLDRAVLATGFVSGRRLDSAHNRAEFTAVDLRSQSVRRPGSAAIVLAWDRGRQVEAYWRRMLKPWDWIPGWLLITEAGGRMSEYNGASAQIDSVSLVASNGQTGIHDEILATIVVFGRRAFNAETLHGAGMHIDRRYRGRPPRLPWPIIVLLVLILVPAGYLLVTRTRFFEKSVYSLQPTPTPTRSAVSYLAQVEDDYKAGRLVAAAEGYQHVIELEPTNDEALRQIAWSGFCAASRNEQ